MGKKLDKSELPPIDVPSALERIGGEKDFLDELLDLYSSEFSKYFKKLQDAIHNKNFLSIQEVGHTLKGSSANLSLPGLQEASLQMEMAGKRKNSKKAKEALHLLDKEIRKLKDHIKNL